MFSAGFKESSALEEINKTLQSRKEIKKARAFIHPRQRQ